VLGEEWHSYAMKSVYKKIDEGSSIAIPSLEIFNAALEIWLEIQKDIKAGSDTQSQSNASNASLKTSVAASDQSTFDFQGMLIEERKTDNSLPQTPGENNLEVRK